VNDGPVEVRQVRWMVDLCLDQVVYLRVSRELHLSCTADCWSQRTPSGIEIRDDQRSQVHAPVTDQHELLDIL